MHNYIACRFYFSSLFVFQIILFDCSVGANCLHVILYTVDINCPYTVQQRVELKLGIIQNVHRAQYIKG